MGTRCPTLFDKWHGIFYMPNRTDTAGHTKAFIYPVMDHWDHQKVLGEFFNRRDIMWVFLGGGVTVSVPLMSCILLAS